MGKTWFHTMYQLIENKYPKLMCGLQGSISSPEEQKDPQLTTEQKNYYARLHWYRIVEESIEEESRKWLKDNMETKTSLRYYAMFKKQISLDTYLRDTNTIGVSIKIQLRAGVYRLASTDLRTKNSNGHCSCCSDGTVETRAHFLLYCSAYDGDRNNLIQIIERKLITSEEHGSHLWLVFKEWVRQMQFNTSSRDEKSEDLQMCFILDASPPALIMDRLLAPFQESEHQPQRILEQFKGTIEKATRKFLQLVDKKRSLILTSIIASTCE